LLRDWEISEGKRGFWLVLVGFGWFFVSSQGNEFVVRLYEVGLGLLCEGMEGIFERKIEN